jgi:hypothetical protein
MLPRHEELDALCEKVEKRIREIRDLLEQPVTPGQIADLPAISGRDPEETSRAILYRCLIEIRFFVDKELRDQYWEDIAYPGKYDRQ